MIYAALVNGEVVGVVDNIVSNSEAWEVAIEKFGNDITDMQLLTLTDADEDMEDAFGDSE